MDWLGQDTVCYHTLDVIYTKFIRGKYQNTTISLISPFTMNNSVWLDTYCDVSETMTELSLKPCYKGERITYRRFLM